MTIERGFRLLWGPHNCRLRQVGYGRCVCIRTSSACASVNGCSPCCSQVVERQSNDSMGVRLGTAAAWPQVCLDGFRSRAMRSPTSSVGELLYVVEWRGFQFTPTRHTLLLLGAVSLTHRQHGVSKRAALADGSILVVLTQRGPAKRLPLSDLDAILQVVQAQMACVAHTPTVWLVSSAVRVPACGEASAGRWGLAR
jgi:hypothetical protein